MNELLDMSGLNEVAESLRGLALQNMKDQIKTGHYTQPQQLAMVEFEALSLAKDLDLFPILVKGNIIDKIKKMNLYAVHPDGFNSIEEACELVGGISRTQYSIITNLYEIVFPYVVKEMGMTINEFWHTVGKSNAAEVLPYLREVITGERSKSRRVNQVVDSLYEDIRSIELNLTDEDIKHEAVMRILAWTEGTVKDVRAQTHPNGTPNPLGVVISKGDTNYIVIKADYDQMEKFRRLTSNWLDLTPYKGNVKQLPYIKEILDV